MSERNNDRSGRWRSKTVAFRMSEEEAKQLDMLVAISGLTKQDYITSKLLNREVQVIPSSRIQRNLGEIASKLIRELEALGSERLTQELQESIATFIDVFTSLGDVPKPQAEDPLLHLTANEALNTSTSVERGNVDIGKSGDV